MAQTCPKCGHERQEADEAPEGQCPRCGIVYARYVEAQRKRVKQPVPGKPRREPKEKSRFAIDALSILAWVITLFGVGAGIVFCVDAFWGPGEGIGGWSLLSGLACMFGGLLHGTLLTVIAGMADDLAEIRENTRGE